MYIINVRKINKKDALIFNYNVENIIINIKKLKQKYIFYYYFYFIVIIIRKEKRKMYKIIA